MGRADKGIILTTGSFTREAQKKRCVMELLQLNWLTEIA